MVRSVIFFIFFLISIRLQAQEVRELATDRPGLGSDAPVTVPKGFLQLEAGFQLDRDRFSVGTIEVEENVWAYPTTLLRYGILNHWELRVSFDALSIESSRTNSSLTQTAQGISPISIGSKVMLTEEEGWIPTMALQFGLSLGNSGSEPFQSEFTQPTITWLMTKSITEKLGATVNLGAEWGDTSPAADYSYALSLDMSLQDKLGAFLEFYGNWPERSSGAHAVNYGLTYLIFNDLQFDISSGVGLNAEAVDYFIGIGLSGRIDVLNKQ